MRSGLLTGLAMLVLSLSGAAAGALLAQKFGRNARTDGFLAAYGIYLVLTTAAQSFRLVVVPELTRAAEQGRLGQELRAYALAFVALAVPVSVLVAVLARPVGDALTGSLPPAAAAEASAAVPWVVAAAFAQLLAALAASALAVLDSYGTAAAGYAAGGIGALALFAALADGHGLIALAWGIALNGAITAAVPLVRLGSLAARLGRGIGPLEVPSRLWRLVQGAAVPIVLQAFYVVALRLVSGLGVGEVTSFSYAYLLAVMLITATAFSLGLISSAPLTRRGLDAERAAEHVVHSSWVSLALVGAAAGVFALVGGRIVAFVLGEAYAGVGRIVVELAPWMVATIAFYAVFPLVFVLGHRRALVPVALGSLLLDGAVGYGLREAFGTTGVAVGLALATLAIVAALLYDISPRTLAVAFAGLARLAVLVTLSAVVAFGLPSLVLPAPAAAPAGLLVYVLLLLSLRAFGLREAWAYVRALH
ncbi:MAG: hypothetical protein ABR569_01100 [Gaiellaceae bacterium]